MITLLLQCCPDTAQVVKCVYELEAATSDKDVQIAQEICGAIVIVTAILVGGFVLWKLLDHTANGIRGIYKRKCDNNDCLKRQEADLKDKMLSALEKNTSKEEYINTLRTLIESNTIPEFPSK